MLSSCSAVPNGILIEDCWDSFVYHFDIAMCCWFIRYVNVASHELEHKFSIVKPRYTPGSLIEFFIREFNVSEEMPCHRVSVRNNGSWMSLNRNIHYEISKIKLNMKFHYPFIHSERVVHFKLAFRLLSNWILAVVATSKCETGNLVGATKMAEWPVQCMCKYLMNWAVQLWEWSSRQSTAATTSANARI